MKTQMKAKLTNKALSAKIATKARATKLATATKTSVTKLATSSKAKIAAAKNTKLYATLKNRLSNNVIILFFVYIFLNILGFRYLKSLDKATLLKSFLICKTIFKIFVYINIICAILLYIINLAQVENNFTIDLIPYLFLYIFYFFRDNLTVSFDNIINFLRNIIERFIKDLNDFLKSFTEVKPLKVKISSDRSFGLYTTNTEVNSQSNKAYKIWKDSGKITEVTPNYESNYYFYVKIAIGLIIIGTIFYLINSWHESPVLTLSQIGTALEFGYQFTKKIIVIPTRIVKKVVNVSGRSVKKIWNLFRRGRRGGGGDGILPQPVTSNIKGKGRAIEIWPNWEAADKRRRDEIFELKEIWGIDVRSQLPNEPSTSAKANVLSVALGTGYEAIPNPEGISRRVRYPFDDLALNNMVEKTFGIKRPKSN
uniref:Uncharacterized protein n=1 Tax=Fomitiporia mediterranea TaxID=208960 RepID=A0A5B9RCH2_9AGAM|nr:hypothetical protein Fomme_000103 [Fomitiporia mediterranea]QEG57113.1 hypothetical protein Fomme_000103 [Fomitiporia mediterranea]